MDPKVMASKLTESKLMVVRQALVDGFELDGFEGRIPDGFGVDGFEAMGSNITSGHRFEPWVPYGFEPNKGLSFSN